MILTQPNTPMSNSPSVVGIILAGGLAKRMGGGDKCLLPLAGKTLLQRTVERAQPQVASLLLNANGNSLRFARTRLPVIPDVYPGNLGPLAGVHAGLSWMQSTNPDAEWLASFASDSPFFPADLVTKLFEAATSQNAQLAVASSKNRTHPIFALWHASLLGKIEQQLQTGDIPRLQDWIKQQKLVEVEFTAEGYDPFFNINVPQDLYAAEPLVALVK
jgi:molybdopterin-guanine dinucleotide biosynthesis protein A